MRLLPGYYVMAGLVPAIAHRSVPLLMAGTSPAMTRGGVCGRLTCGADDQGMRGGWVYIMANRPFGTLYVGVTNDLARRAWEHRTGIGGRFTSRYRLGMLVYSEWHEEIGRAIQRETSIKRWPRQWKLNLIETQNPQWRDLFETLLA